MSHKKKSDIAQKEAEILQYWEENDIFKKTLQKDAPKGEFVFYDGPPFATGTPHYGHILPGTIKDAIPRFRTMQGYHVERQWGWDTHGLPLENQVEEHLGLETKKDVEEYGIEKFNEVAKDFVLQYADDWKKIIPRTGRWVDMENDYRTMDSGYTESIWWAFGRLNKKELIYEGFKAMQICPRCETPLSNFEVNQGYHEQKDITVTVKLPLADDPDTSLLIWTTTPWTLPGNMAVAVNPDLQYVKVSSDGENYIVAKERAEEVFADKEYEIAEEFLGEELVAKTYQPPFDYFQDADIEGKKNAWKVYGADFVTLEEGTGLVHIAPAFGANDLAMAEEFGISIVHHVTESGEFTQAVTDFAGMKVKPRDEGDEEHLLADIEILKYLAAEEILFAKENLHHQYPLCWRCETPLLNYATTSWFVEVSKFKDELVAENKNVGWTPEAIGTNRFGNWLEAARDWAISRERFWGAPLPVWKSADGETVEVIDSLKELKEKTKSKNNFYIMRHGEADHNVAGIMSSSPENSHSLTETGKAEVKAAAKELADAEIDCIYVSPLVRTKETAKLLASELGLSKKQIIVDERIIENEAGSFEGKLVSEWHEAQTEMDRFEESVDGAENYADIRTRMMRAIFDINEKHTDENILFVGHGLPLSLLAWTTDLKSSDDIAQLRNSGAGLKTGELKELDFWPYPHNRDFELDFHRPYIDEVTWKNDDGHVMSRIDAVFDCWFESGSMSYASKHYPLSNNDFDPESGKGYPADFVAEGLDQTRGWFYSSLVLGVGLFDKSPYENVIVSGLVMAEDGQKMSKSKGNYPPVEDVLDEYGADALRFFLLNSPLVRGENVTLSKDEIDEVVKKVMYRITNTYSFVQMYSNASQQAEALEVELSLDNVLDRWIIGRLDQLITDVTKGLENYQLDKASQPITGFVDDLSTWYLRRSRDRIRAAEAAERQEALATLLYVLEKLSLLLAPFMPFLAESLYRDITDGRKKESVHLEDWPTPRNEVDRNLLENMEVVRQAASHAHDLRSQAELKVRQPLSTLTLKSERLDGNDELLDILRDEVNVEKIEFDPELDEPATLDTALTPELKEAGAARELLRNIQRLRKQAELDPATKVTLAVETNVAGKVVIAEHRQELTSTASIEEVNFTPVTDGAIVDVHDFHFEVKLDI